MSRPPLTNTPVPNPAFIALRTTPENDQVSPFSVCDPNTPVKIARRLGTRYAAA